MSNHTRSIETADETFILAAIMKQRAEKLHGLRSALCAGLMISLGASCSTTQAPAPAAPAAPQSGASADAVPKPAPSAQTPPSVPAASSLRPAIFRAATWSELPGWREDNVSEAWTAFLASCTALSSREFWREPCAAASRMTPTTSESARQFFEQHFTPYRVVSADGGEEGLITGYYEPLLRGSRKASSRYRHAVYGVPDDLVVVDLAEVYPELKTMRLRGRLEGRRLVPYPDRAAIENGHAPLRGKEIAWVDDPLDLFFLQIQGSGRILLDTGETIRVGYADQNGHPYRSIGRVLVERGELTLEQASMQSIKAWARSRPDQMNPLLNTKASYVFFRELPASAGGPPGSLGVPLTAQRSIAVDRTHVPLGAPVFVATTWPGTARPLNRLMLAQDTGGAIRGAVRGDFFWGYGEAAAREAGRMKQRLRLWVLLPNGYPVPSAGN